MDPTPEEFKAAIERILKSLAEKRGEDIAGMLKPILFTNLDRGRIQGFVEGNIDLVDEYVQRLADLYLNLNPYLRQLQTGKKSDLWATLFKRMRIWAYNFLVRKGFAADETTQDIAAECASEAAVNMLGAYFPYDTDFDPWAHVIVQNACRKFIRTRLKKSVIPEDSLVDIEDEMAGLSETPVEKRESGNEGETNLLEALEHLSDSRRQVLELIYFEELTPEEVAHKMGKSVGGVYSLKFHALEDLRKILSKNGDILNE